MKWWQDFKAASRLKKTLVIISGLILFAIMTLDSYVLHSSITFTLLGFEGILIIFSLLLLMSVVGYAVLRALFHVAAGLSLMIFLTQSYCAVSNYTAGGDNALKGLLAFSMVYICFDFFRKLYEIWDGNSDGGMKEFNRFERPLLIGLIVVFAGLFVWMIYQAISPIVFSFCVYHR